MVSEADGRFMVDMTAQGSRKALSIDGIKLSRELVWLNLQDLAIDPRGSHLHFLRQLSGYEINLPFITTRYSRGRVHLCCCAAAEDEIRLRKVLRPENGFGGFELVAPVGLISMFPHRCNLHLLWVLTNALKAASLPVYGFASSISSLTFVTDHSELDTAVAAVKQYVNLPRGFVPSRPEFRIRQRSPGVPLQDSGNQRPAPVPRPGMENEASKPRTVSMK